MAIRSDNPVSWFRAGFIFGITTIMMLFIAIDQVGSYYFEEQIIGGEPHTKSEWCSETRAVTDAGDCRQWKFNAQISVVLTLFSIGFGTMCFAQSRHLEPYEEE